jgi:hypothetical protein
VFEITLDIREGDMVQSGISFVAADPVIGEALEVIDISAACARRKVLLNVEEGLEVIEGTGEFDGGHSGNDSN